jgi:putative transposase
MLVHHGRKGERKGFREKDFAALTDAAHQQLGGPVVLVWDNYTHHVDAAMRELIEARSWLTVFRFPSYTPDLNPAEGLWAHLKNSLGNLAPCSLDELAALARTRLKRMQYQPGLLDASSRPSRRRVQAGTRGWRTSRPPWICWTTRRCTAAPYGWPCPCRPRQAACR